MHPAGRGRVRAYWRSVLAIAAVLSTGCGTQPSKPSVAHLTATTAPPRTGTVPPPVTQAIPVPPPEPAPPQDTFSVSVVNVPVQELLFALARDARLNVDVHPGIQGTVTLNAVHQTLPQLLHRLSRQVDMRYEMEGPNLIVMPDTPFLRHYKIDYVNMTRDATATVAIATQIQAGTATAAAGGASPVGGLGQANSSNTSLSNTAKNRFWETLVQNIKDLLRETDKVLPEGSYETAVQQDTLQSTTGTGVAPPPTRGSRERGISLSPQPATVQTEGTTVIRRATFREAASVIANPETGVLSIRATARQHEKIQEFLDQVMTSARRQVLIEATVVEVSLSDHYQQGIDWRAFVKAGGKWTLTQQTLPTLPTAVGATLFTGTYSGSDDFSATLRLLESFGTVKVLSSPKVSVINNQTALLKVVENRVYFTVKADTVTTANVGTITTFTTTPNTVSVGFVMSVTPQISEADTVILNVRPTVSRITGFVNDPNPSLQIPNRIPEIQTREMESVIRVASGDVAVMGGLMQDGIENRDDTVPGLAQIPLLGKLFAARNDTRTTTELVIFLRPTVIRNASLEGDYAALRPLLPDEKFLEAPRLDNFFGAEQTLPALPAP
ncbi:MAG: pilus (MSHA type) biogenesis protein MshL [Azospira oryzae]|nr:MAG: pilus (MSHA type) biogenesis protein MshL [Azospira oryzae]PZP81793.1 MAG: pilus (MSHA type) biogenesis protein MshL [Azospira oryzae]